MSVSIVQKERVEITALNQPSNGAYSFKGGFPIIQFQIPAEAKFLDGDSVRLNGTLRVCQPTSTEAVPVLPNNNGNKGGGAFNTCLSSRIGVASTIDQIMISSMTNQSLEVVRSYGRFLTSQAVTHSQEDFDTNVQLGSLTASRKLNGALGVNNDVSFSMPLRCGLLRGAGQLPLGMNGLRGLQIQLQLSPDSQVLSGWVNNAGAKQNDSATGTGCFYQLRDLTLSYDLLVPDADGAEAMSTPSTGSLEYNSISQLYSVINSSDQTQTFQLGVSKCLSVFNNFIPTTHINNYAEDGFATEKLLNIDAGSYSVPAPIKRVSFLKGGVLYPIENEVDVQSDNTVSRPLTELDQLFIGSVKPGHLQNHTLMSLNTNNDISTATSPLDGRDLIYSGTPSQQFVLPDRDSVFGVGVAQDPYREGVNYTSDTFGVRIVSDLDGASPNSMYSFVLAKNVLTYSPAGISVMA